MECSALKDKLKAKDIEIENRNKNTVEIFELIKDDVLESFINYAISAEFKSYGQMLHKESVLKIIAKSKNVDIGYPLWVNLSENYFWNTNCLRERWDGDGVNGRINLEDVFGDVDYEKLKIMLSSHLLDNGFKYKWATNILGKKVKTDFLITTRKALEARCCGENSDQSGNTDGSKDLAIGLIFVIAIVLIFFGFAFFM